MEIKSGSAGNAIWIWCGYTGLTILMAILADTS